MKRTALLLGVCLLGVAPGCVRMVPTTDRTDATPDARSMDRAVTEEPLDLLTTDGLPVDLASQLDSEVCPPCAAASATCWHVQAVLTKTDFDMYPVEVFGKTVTDGQTVYALLDGTSDNTYTEPDDSCPPFYAKAPRAKTWDIERKQIGPGAHQIVVRGQSMADCNLGQPICAGSFRVNTDCWKISQVTSCDVQSDSSGHNVTIPTFCTVDQQSGTVSWQSGGQCGLCCQCADAAQVTIEVTVTVAHGQGG